MDNRFFHTPKKNAIFMVLCIFFASLLFVINTVIVEKLRYLQELRFFDGKNKDHSFTCLHGLQRKKRTTMPFCPFLTKSICHDTKKDIFRYVLDIESRI
jgi:hypothetical protein